MVVVPVPTAVTLKPMLVVPIVIGREEGTVATPVLLEFKVTLKFDEAAEERVSVMLPSTPVICKEEGESAMLVPMVTTVVAELRPLDVAVIVAVPAALAFKLGWREGEVWPALKKMPVKLRLAFAGSLLTRSTRSPFGEGAGLARVTLKGMLSPGFIESVAGIMMSIAGVTVTICVAVV